MTFRGYTGVLAVLTLIFRLAMLVVGSVLVYTVVAMFPDEEGRLQNRVENLWIAIDDKQRSAAGKAIALLNRVASIVTRIYNRILGPKLVSIQMIGVSSSSSISGFFIFAALGSWTLLYLSLSTRAPVTTQFNISLLAVGVVCCVFGIAALPFAFLPSVFRNWLGRTISLVPLLLLTRGLVLVLKRQRGALASNELSVLVALTVGVLTDILVLAAVRLSVRLIVDTDKIMKIVWAVFMQVGLLILIFLGPYEVSTPLLSANKNSFAAKVLSTSMMFNFFTMLGVSAFLVLLVVLMVHRALWPLLGRFIYSIARFRPLQNNRKLVAIIGIVCMLYGLGLASWSNLVAWFATKFNPLR